MTSSRPTVRADETPLARTRRARRIDKILAETYPDAHCELDFTTPLELAVATILSAQSTDAGVNKVTPALFAKYPTAADYAAADRAELEEMIHSTGFFRAKTNSLIGLGQALVERYDGEVPPRLRDLVTLPGIGRKTANVVLGNAFGIPGITVDTHFGRLARRFGWTTQDDPVKVEHEVGALFPKRDWTMLSHRLIFHGRRMLPRPQAGLRGLPGGPALPGVRRGRARPGQGGEAGQVPGPGGDVGVTRRAARVGPAVTTVLAVLALLGLVAGCTADAAQPRTTGSATGAASPSAYVLPAVPAAARGEAGRRRPAGPAAALPRRRARR